MAKIILKLIARNLDRNSYKLKGALQQLHGSAVENIMMSACTMEVSVSKLWFNSLIEQMEVYGYA